MASTGKRKRDARYYDGRLRRDYPAIHAALRAGKYRSVRAAAAAAGLIRLPGRLGALKREWKKASSTDKLEFIKWIKSRARGTHPLAATATLAISAPDGRLNRDVTVFIRDWLAAHRAKPGHLMKEIGYSVYDYRISMALNGWPLPADVIARLRKWLGAHGFTIGPAK